MTLRLAIAGFALESASFVPALTDIDVFEASARRGPALGALRGTNSVVGGFIDVCESAGVAWHGLVLAEGGAAGMASDAAFDRYLGETLDGLDACLDTVDGLLLFLHGAMVTPQRPAADLAFVRALRERFGRDLPVALGMDLHGNISPELAEHVDIVCGYHESPHVDMGETGRRAARLLIAALRGEVRPVSAVARPGLALPSIFTATSLAPLRGFVDETIGAPGTQGALLDASLFTGFAYADAPHCGAAVVAVADGDRGIAQAFADDLAGRLHAARHALFKRELLHDVAGGIARAVALSRDARAPVVVLEHADRVNDSTWCLRALLEVPDLRVAVPYLWDPASAAQAAAAGIGAELDLQVGGHSSPQSGAPVALRARVRWAGDKHYVGTGPMRRGVPVHLGLTALVEVGGILIWLTSRSLSAIDLDPFVQFDLDVADFDIVVLRSKTHFRAAWEAVASAIVIVDTPDWGPADLRSLPYRHVPAGVFPINAD